MKNTDCCIIINREQDGDEDTGKQYMGFKLEKFRGKPNKDRIYLFLHPFDEHNQILLKIGGWAIGSSSIVKTSLFSFIITSDSVGE